MEVRRGDGVVLNTGSVEHLRLCLQDISALQDVAAYQKEQEESYQEQLRLAAEQRKTMLDAFAERIAQGRAKKRHEKGGDESEWRCLLCKKHHIWQGNPQRL